MPLLPCLAAARREERKSKFATPLTTLPIPVSMPVTVVMMAMPVTVVMVSVAVMSVTMPRHRDVGAQEQTGAGGQRKKEARHRIVPYLEHFVIVSGLTLCSALNNSSGTRRKVLQKIFVVKTVG